MTMTGAGSWCRLGVFCACAIGVTLGGGTEANAQALFVAHGLPGEGESAVSLLDPGGALLSRFGALDTGTNNSEFRAHLARSGGLLYRSNGVVLNTISRFDGAGDLVDEIVPNSSARHAVLAIAPDFDGESIFFVDVFGGSNVIWHLDDPTTGSAAPFATVSYEGTAGVVDLELGGSPGAQYLYALSATSPDIADGVARIARIDRDGNITLLPHHPDLLTAYVQDVGALAVDPRNGDLVVATGTLLVRLAAAGVHLSSIPFEDVKPSLQIDDFGTLYVGRFDAGEVVVMDEAGDVLDVLAVPDATQVYDVWTGAGPARHDEIVYLLETSFAGEDRLNVDGASDMDVNDFVIDIGGCAVLDGQAVSRLAYVYNVRHVGAGSISNGFFHTVPVAFDAENPPVVHCVDTLPGGSALDPATLRAVSAVSDRGAVQFPVYGDTRDPYGGLGGFIYTDPAVDVTRESRLTECVLSFPRPLPVDTAALLGDPFLNRIGTGQRGGGDAGTAIEVHAITHPLTPFYTADADPAVLGMLDNGAPAGFFVPRPGWMPPIERTNLVDAYPDIATDHTGAWYDAPVAGLVFELDAAGDPPPSFQIPTGSLCEAAPGCLTDAECAAGEICFFGECAEPACAPQGELCGGGSTCCTGLECVDGACQADPCDGVVCTASADCHIAYCDGGECVEEVLPDGEICDDGDACTLTDRCIAGICAGQEPVECLAADECHLPGLCDVASGLCSDPPAEDGTACSLGRTCQSGSCTDASCQPDLGDCDGDPANGCEVDLTSNGDHCGDCDEICDDGDTCQGSVCVTPVASGQVRREFWITDGNVNAVAAHQGVIYIGGEFTAVGPSMGPGAILDPDDASALPQQIVLNGRVNAVIADGSGGYYVGGLFTIPGALPVNLVHLLPDGSLDPLFVPQPNAAVVSLALTGDRLYAGGGFTQIGGQPRGRLAALDAATGTAHAWAPSPNQPVLAIAPSGAVVFIGGTFSDIDGQSRNNLAALDAETGAVTAWNPNPNGAVREIVVAGSQLYVGGDFSFIGGQARDRVAALDVATGSATSWSPAVDNRVLAILVTDSAVYIGGPFQSVGGNTRAHLAAIDRTTGELLPWHPAADNPISDLVMLENTIFATGTFNWIGGVPRRGLAAIDSNTGVVTDWDAAPLRRGGTALAVSGSTLYAGGNFASFGVVPRSDLAALDSATGSPTPWAPDVQGTVLALAATDSTIYVGGSFSSVAGQARNNLAALDVTSGHPSAWNPDLNGQVNVLALQSDAVYAGGMFTLVGGQSRIRLAAIDPDTAAPTSWSPTANGTVRAIAFNDETIYVGGEFNHISGVSRSYLAAFDAASGDVTAWNPSPSGAVQALTTANGVLYVGGNFTSIAALARSRIAAFDSAGVATGWNPGASSPVLDIAVYDSVVYLTGTFTAVGGAPRNRLAAVDATTGLVTPWHVDLANPGLALAVTESSVLVGGTFDAVHGHPAPSFAAIAR